MSNSKKIWLGVGGVAVLAGIIVLLLVLLAQPRSPQERFLPVDLSRHTNGSLHTSWLPNEDPGNNLASLPGPAGIGRRPLRRAGPDPVAGPVLGQTQVCLARAGQRNA